MRDIISEIAQMIKDGLYMLNPMNWVRWFKWAWGQEDGRKLIVLLVIVPIVLRLAVISIRCVTGHEYSGYNDYKAEEILYDPL